jgi:hypothetical protein
MKRGLVLLALPLVILGTWATMMVARAAQPQATVTYYYIPGCTTCARTSARLTDVTSHFAGRVAIRLVRNDSDEGRAANQRHGFLSHGVVLTTADGKEALAEADHRVFPEHVEAALGRVLPR